MAKKKSTKVAAQVTPKKEKKWGSLEYEKGNGGDNSD
jgi:hypothetical protein